MENSKPLVSVVIPVYNAQHTLEKAVRSALLQDVPLRVIIIDDASTDGTSQVIDRLIKERAVTAVRNEVSLGAAASRNKGVSLSDTPYIAFLDSDDYWREGKLRLQLEAMKRDKTVLCTTGRELMTPEGKLTGRVIPCKQSISYRDLLKTNSINCSSVLVKREAVVRFPMEHEDAHEDYITWMKILRAYGKASGVCAPLLCYRQSSSGKSGSKLKSAKMTFRSYRYMGFGICRSLGCFFSYAWHGVCKYALAAAFAGRKT